MTSYFVISVASFLTAALTLYSGFGLGTLLMPVFALFFPVEGAVAATAVVHGANNAFKIVVVGKHSDPSLVLRFGIPALFAAFAGAAALGYVSHFDSLAVFSIGSVTAEITPVKVVMGALIFAFAWFELLPRLRQIQFDRKYLVVGGVLSGFFGGLSGHQGALRSAFLAKVGISTEAFVGTNAAIGFLVDAARISTYAFLYFFADAEAFVHRDQWPLVLVGVLSAFAGVAVAKRYLHKITMRSVQTLTGILLLVIAVALGSGIL